MQKLIQRFNLRLPPDDLNWFAGAWQHFHSEACSYNQPLDPEATLECAESVWGGQMLPDTIPILANGAGDYLCARFNHDGTLSEIIEWLHEGYHWRHFGYSINQALAFDQMEYRRNVTDNGDDDAETTPLPSALSPIAVSEAACTRALESSLDQACSRIGGGRLAELAGVSWTEFRSWLPDPSQIPASQCEQLAAALGMRPEEMVHQDWDAALAHAQSVLKLRPDLAWPYAVAGRALERSGRIGDAVKMYKAGARKLGTSSSFTAKWSRVPHSGKFLVDRLLAFADAGLEPDIQEYANATVERRVSSYWLTQANAATQREDPKTAYECLYAAGWDAPGSPDIATTLKAMSASAKQAGSPTWEAILELHIATVS